MTGLWLTIVCVAAVRKNRYVIIPADFEKGYSSNVKKDEGAHLPFVWSIARLLLTRLQTARRRFRLL